MEKQPCEETCEKCQEKEKITSSDVKAKAEIKELSKNKVKDFAETILKILSMYETQQDKDYRKWLGVSNQDRITVDVDYPLYQQSQACYAVNKLLEKETKIKIRTSYSSGERSAAEYQDVEVKRDTYESLLVFGKIFFEWKKVKCICSVYFRGNYAEAHFILSKKDAKRLQELQAMLRSFMIKHNFFKGEKLEFLEYSRLRFLKYPAISWGDLILKDSLKEEIDLNLLFPLAHRRLCEKHKVPWRRGVLLAGVPGTGKTQLGRVLCNVLKGVTVLWTTCKAVHDTSRVKSLFDIARNFAPTLIIMEDLDFFGHDREFITNPVVGELLNQLDGNAPNEGIFILATTNRPHLLDRALADRPSRFDVKLRFDLPELEERKKMIKLFATGKQLAVSNNYLANATKDLTGSHIKEVINYATLLTLKNGREVVEKPHIERALRKIKNKLQKEKNRKPMVS